MQFQFKIQIKGITNPPVWRRLLLPADFSFYDLHKAVQAAFGWENYHLFQFSPKGYGSNPTITAKDDEGFFNDADALDARSVILSKVFKKEKQKYTYIYDFGDDWKHSITLEKIFAGELLLPKLIKGKGQCPPEDCGGVWGYDDIKEILSDTKHPQYEEMAEWVGLESGELWNPEEFNPEETQEILTEIFS